MDDGVVGVMKSSLHVENLLFDAFRRPSGYLKTYPCKSNNICWCSAAAAKSGTVCVPSVKSRYTAR